MRWIAIILAFISLFITGCSNTGNSAKKNAGVNTSLKYEKAPVITADTEVYNVMDFGAFGDGKKHDTDAIKEAYEYVSNNGGGIIYFPPGRYIVEGTLDLENPNGSKVVFAGNPDRKRETLIQSTRSLNKDFISLSGSNIHFTYLTIRNLGETGSVVNMKSDNCTLTECSFLQENPKNEDTAIIVSGSNNAISSCYFGPGTTNGYIVNFAKEPGRMAKNNSLTDSYLGGGLPKSVLIDTKDEGSCPEDIFISRNVFLFPAIGQVYVVSVKGLKIHNNMLDAATTAIILNPDSTGIRDVDIRYNYMGSQNKDISMFVDRTDMPGSIVTDIANGGNIENVVVTDNYFWGYYGIRITSSKFGSFKIINNYFVESNGSSIYITESVNNIIEGNIIYSGVGADYTVYIGKMDDKTVFKDNTIAGSVSVPDLEKYKDMNMF